MRHPLLGAALFTLASFVGHSQPAAGDARPFHAWAPRPPMGWNSWDCFATTVTEAQTKAQADAMAARLKAHGWEYVVVDHQWYEAGANDFRYREGVPFLIDGYGRFQPVPNRFPSAANGAGFKALADYVHSLGLKFGVHLMRGIPRQAVEKNLPILGTPYHAADIADRTRTCAWNTDMWGVDMNKPGAQEYYDSVFAMFAAWGLDYVKVDDLSRPYLPNHLEVEAIRKAIDKTGRPIVLSLSPGETPLDAASHVPLQANLWRISDDFWDNWSTLHEQFARLKNWAPFRRPGAWPDADMLPLGVIDLGRRSTRFTPDEQRTVMTLWSVARSPLIFGGDLTKLDEPTLALITNDEVLAVNQQSSNNRQLFDRDDLIAWVADVPGSADKYLAVFNARERIPLQPDRAVFTSPIVTRLAPPHETVMDLEVRGATSLVLVATNAGDGSDMDHALWINPRVILADGSEISLLDRHWDRADAFWSNLSTTKSPSGKSMAHLGKPVARGLAAHAPALFEYALPAGAVRFAAIGALDDAAVQAGRGGSIEFRVFLAHPGDGSERKGLPVAVNLATLGFTGPVRVRDLWAQQDAGTVSGEFVPQIEWHGAGLYRLSPVRP